LSRLIRFVIVTAWKPIVLAVLISGVACAPKGVSSPFGLGKHATDIVHTASPSASTMLPWVGGLATIGGIIALVLTRGSVGGRAIIIGVLLVVLNEVMHRYADAFFVPILIGTACVSLAYAWRTLRHALNVRKNGCPSGKSSVLAAGRTSSGSGRVHWLAALWPGSGSGEDEGDAQASTIRAPIPSEAHDSED